MGTVTELDRNQVKSSHGGKRPGAGRKAGSASKKTREIADKAAEAGVTPLEVMLEAMREAYQAGGAVAAFGFAKEAAPFMHAKLSSSKVDATVKTRTVDEAIEELDAALSASQQN